MYKLEYADKTTDDAAFWGITPNGRTLMIIMQNKSFSEMAELFSNTEKTKSMKVYKNDELIDEKSGYTKMIRLVYEPNGIRVVLNKEDL